MRISRKMILKNNSKHLCDFIKNIINWFFFLNAATFRQIMMKDESENKKNVANLPDSLFISTANTVLRWHNRFTESRVSIFFSLLFLGLNRIDLMKLLSLSEQIERKAL